MLVGVIDVYCSSAVDVVCNANVDVDVDVVVEVVVESGELVDGQT